MKSKFLFLFFVVISLTSNAQSKKFKIHTIAFYNVENLFDTIRDVTINDEEYLPENGWTYKKYRQKLRNLERVISEIGTSDQQPNGPVILGVCEIENRRVLEDLVQMPKLAKKDYGIIHFDSPDGRGIDVGLLYQKAHFVPTSFASIPLRVKRTDDPEKWLKSRDQLLVTGLLDGEEISFIVNHWPSRSGGEKRSSPYREAAGALNKKIMDSLYAINPEAKVITMGDLNDGPFNNSLKKSIGTVGKKEDLKKGGYFNPMEELSKKGIGTLAYRDAWDLFDQMVLTEPLVRSDFSSFRFWKAGVFNRPYMIETQGQYKGYPLRNSPSEPGFSDHFPVFVYLIKEVK
ncbi:MAG: endonuclease/exonuclease/phosphatase family protein [Flavobacteriales bacterium]|nr:endonuclease/exonuclease/phosphatase family protein [Flavobacteriales bacterium]